MSTEDEAVEAAEKVLADVRHIMVNAQAGEFITTLLNPTVAGIRELVDALVDATAKSIPVFRATVGDEAGDLVALSQVVHTCRTRSQRALAEVASYAIVELAKAKLAARDA